MRTLLKLTATSGMLAILSGCAGVSDGNSLDALSNIDASGASAFNQALSADYASYAVYEAETETEAEAEFVSEGEGEVKLKDDVGLFVRKAVSAGNNEMVEPENVMDWPIPNDRVIILNAHRTIMMNEFAKGAKVSHPALAGRAQAQFDCWVEEEAEGADEGAVDTDCMVNHKDAMSRIKSP